MVTPLSLSKSRGNYSSSVQNYISPELRASFLRIFLNTKINYDFVFQDDRLKTLALSVCTMSFSLNSFEQHYDDVDEHNASINRTMNGHFIIMVNE